LRTIPGLREVAIYPNGEHGKFFNFQGWRCKRGFTMTVRSSGHPMGSLMFRLRGKILVVNPSSGCGEAQHFADGLAPIIVQRIGELLRQLLRDDGSDCRAEYAFSPGACEPRHSDRQGLNRLHGDIEDLKANDDVCRRYLALQRYPVFTRAGGTGLIPVCGWRLRRGSGQRS
jgi:hypothetical protein